MIFAVDLTLQHTRNHGSCILQVETPFLSNERQKQKILVCVKELESEIATLRKLNHNNIVRYLGTERTPTHLNIFLEWMPAGSISTNLKEFGVFCCTEHQ